MVNYIQLTLTVLNYVQLLALKPLAAVILDSSWTPKQLCRRRNSISSQQGISSTSSPATIPLVSYGSLVFTGEQGKCNANGIERNIP